MRYRLICWCLSPLVLVHLLWRTVKDGGLVYLKQRLGYAIPNVDNAIWIHAASVGEINTVAPLIKRIREHDPTCPLFVTTNTPTGKSTWQRLAISHSTHCYLPLDYRYTIKRFIRTNQFRCGLIVETEIWPILFTESTTDLVIINGRLSRRTLRFAEGVLASTYTAAVSRLALVLARSESDGAAFQRIGMSADRVRTLGNLKFARPAVQLTDLSRLLKRRYCLLASTHHNEELLLAREWLARDRQELLVIAPRHPERAATIVRQLTPLTEHIVVRSTGTQMTVDTRIYIADTLGEMMSWYKHADVIFMGGSLCTRGGHNLLEPAQLGNAVVVGPHMQNFVDEVSILQRADAVIQAEDPETVVSTLIQQIDTPDHAASMGQRALEVVQRFETIDSEYLATLAHWTNIHPSASPNSGD